MIVTERKKWAADLEDLKLMRSDSQAAFIFSILDVRNNW
jgi:hypothetical protein